MNTNESILLMHKDVPVAAIGIGYSGTLAGIYEIFDYNRMPVGTHVMDKLITSRLRAWFENRCMPRTRQDIHRVLALACATSPAELMFRANGCSLTDCYWFKEERDTVTKWGDVNFYKNGFDNSIGDTLFGHNLRTPISSCNSPDLTTDGDLPKRWMQNEDGVFCLVKQNGSINEDAIKNEILVSNICDAINMPHVKYNLVTDKVTGTKEAVCENFIKGDNEEFVPLLQLSVEQEPPGFNSVYELLRDYGIEGGCEKIMILDYIVQNNDRHLKNIGIIRDTNTLKILRVAPAYDHDKCMETLNGKPFIQESKLTGDVHEREMDAIRDFSWISKDGLYSIPQIISDTFKLFNDEKNADVLIKDIERRLRFIGNRIR